MPDMLTTKRFCNHLDVLWQSSLSTSWGHVQDYCSNWSQL